MGVGGKGAVRIWGKDADCKCGMFGLPGNMVWGTCIQMWGEWSPAWDLGRKHVYAAEDRWVLTRHCK